LLGLRCEIEAMNLNAIISKSILAAGGVAAFAVAMFPGVAQAGEVDNRVNRQQARINQGVRSGQLTRREYNRDESRLDHINALRERDLARNGGHLMAGEHYRLNRDLNGDSRQIYFTKHNRADQAGV
jgi:hypothetical protein